MLNTRTRLNIVAGGISAAVMISVIASLAWLSTSINLSNSVLSIVGVPILIASVILWRGLAGIFEGVLSKMPFMRRAILGEHDVDGIWLQAESGNENLLSIISASTGPHGLEWKGYVLDSAAQVVGHTSFELTNNLWPNMIFKFSDSLADEGDPWRQGVGELQFERGLGCVTRFTGVMRSGNAEQKRLLNGIKLTDRKERKRLRKIDGHAHIVARYWSVFFSEVSLTALKDNNPSAREKDFAPQNLPNEASHAVNEPASTAPVRVARPAEQDSHGDQKSHAETGEGVAQKVNQPKKRQIRKPSAVQPDAAVTKPANSEKKSRSGASMTRRKAATSANKKSLKTHHADDFYGELEEAELQISAIEEQLRRARAAAEQIAISTLRKETDSKTASGSDPDGLLRKMRANSSRRRRYG